MHTRPEVAALFRTRVWPLALAALALPVAITVAAPLQDAPPRQRTADQPITSSAAMNAAYAAWQQALAARSAFLDPRELSAKSEQQRLWLADLDARLPRFSTPPGTSGWQAALGVEAGAQREAAARKVLSRVEPQSPALDEPAVEGEIASAERSLRSWHARAALLTTDLFSIEQSLAEARTLDEGAIASIRTLVDKWVREGLTRQPGVRAAVAPVLERVEQMESIDREVSSDELLRMARSAGTGKPEQLFSAWRRLSNRGQTVWPATQADLEAEVALRPLLLQAAASVPNRDRSRELKAEVTLEQARRLTRLLSAAVDDATLSAGDAAVRDLELSVDTLDNRVRYNLLLNRLKRDVSARGITDDRSRMLARDFVTAVRDLQGGIAFLSGANTVVAALDAVAGGLVLSPATVEPGRFGPAAAGLGTGIEKGATLSYTLPSRSGAPEVILEFILVGEGASASYISVHEVTVGQVAAIVAARNAERELPTVLPLFRPLDDSRSGPRSWTWTRDDFDIPQVIPSPSWLSPVALLGGVDYPEGQTPPAPASASPMQHVPVAAAAYIASLAGCRLPTTGEWQALLKEHSPNVLPASANLRDLRWKIFREHMASRKAQNRWFESPNAGIFVPSGAAHDVSEASESWDDGWLWFAPAALAENEIVSHVLGNVAEFTTTVPWVLPSQPEAVRALVAKSISQLRVVGGSALSDPAVDPRSPQELDPIDALEGFSDVGFRLAFGAEAVTRPREQLGLQVIEILTPTPYLKPR